MNINDATQAAIERGTLQARRVLAFREQALATRAEAVERLAATERNEGFWQDAATLDREHVRTVAGVGSAGSLIAEGDSWFDYPWNDVIQLLEDLYAFDVESVAHKGDSVEDMAYGGGQLEEFTRRIEKVLRRGALPRAILLSGGGNDIAGSEFRMLLNHEASPVSGLNQQVLSGIIGERIRFAYATIIAAVTKVCEDKAGRKIPIVVHGYDYPVPDGRGFAGGWWFLPGPWLEPGFRLKGYVSVARRKELARELIDYFNAMLDVLVNEPAFSHVRYVNLRGTLSTEPAMYKEWWADELHPTSNGFKAVTEKIVAAIP